MILSKRVWSAAIAGICLSGAIKAGPVVTVGQSVDAQRRVAIAAIDHGAWSELLRTYVDDDGDVAYATWKASSDSRMALDRYLSYLSSANLTTRSSADAKLAFWINAYNALTIKGILREYPTSSIRNHTARVFGYNIWKDLKLHVGDRLVSLEEIEHQILRPTGDPRIHFAIVCASRSCPRLRNEAYTAERVQDQLEANSVDFFRRSQNFRHDSVNNRLYISTILKWFSHDFGRDRRHMLQRISQWLPTTASRQAARSGRVSVSFLRYDWGLNEQSNRGSASR